MDAKQPHLDFEYLLKKSLTSRTVDVWMTYLATLPIDTSRQQLHRLKREFVRQYRQFRKS